MKNDNNITIVDTNGVVLQVGKYGAGVRIVSEDSVHIMDISEVSDGGVIDIFFKMDKPRAFNSTPTSSEQGMLPAKFEFLISRENVLDKP